MYMGVIPLREFIFQLLESAPHVYGGDPDLLFIRTFTFECSPCIWG